MAGAKDSNAPIEAGNIDLLHRPIAKNADGSISTVRSMSFGEGGREILVPTVGPKGEILSEDEAINLYHKTGQHLGKFSNPDAATAYAEKLHKDQEKTYAKQEAAWAKEHAAATRAPTSQAAPQDATVQLVDRDGALHDVPAAHVANAVASGRFGWVKGSSVPMADPATGIVKEVPAEQASEAIKSGHKLLAGEEAHQHALEKEYGGFTGGLIAGGEGAARGLTAGLSDPLAVEAAGLLKGTETAEKVREHLRNYQEVNPGIAMAGEIAGAVAPMFFGDEAGIADILGSIPRGIGGAGKFAGEVATKLVGTSAEGLLKRAGQKAIKGAATAIVEGGLFSAGSEVSAATLQNRELTAEGIIASAGHGALLAGALGGVLGGAEPLLGKAFSAIGEALPGHGKLSAAADEQYIRAISANKKSFLEQMKDRFGGENAQGRIANRLRSEGIVEAGDNIEKIAAKAAKAESAAVDGLSETVEKVGAGGVRIGDALEALETRAKQFDSRLGFRPAATDIRNKMKEIADIYGPRAEAGLRETGTPLKDYQIPIRDLLEQRRGLERTINWNTDTVLSQGRKAAGRTIEDTIMNAGERAAKEAGNETWKADYLAAKARYSETRFINDVATDAATAKLRNRMASPSDYGAGMTGAVLGGEGGHMIAGGVGGMLLGAVHHQVRQRGNATLAVLLDKLGTFGGLSEMHAGSMARLDSAIDASLANRVGGVGVRAAKKVALGDFSHERFEKEASRVAKLAAAPEAVARHLAMQTATIDNHAPEIAQSVKQKASAAVHYLGTKLPPGYTGEGPNPTLTPNVKSAVSGPAKTGFLRSVDAVERDPADTIRNILRGHGTLEDADALKNVFPAYYAEAQTRVKLVCASRTNPVSYQTAVRLGILFDEPTDPSLQADLIQQEQQMYAQMAKPAGPPGPGGGGKGSRTKPLKLATMMGGMFESGSQEEKA